MRGVPFIQVPTTLLAQVDSSVGGKTGINHPLGKNMIGAFYQPQAVIADTSVLRSLPPRELAAGLAEVIKTAAIADHGFFSWVEANIEALAHYDEAALALAVRRSCELKAKVVGEDERESGLRAILNFGHTFGHAIEAGLGYGEWLHGEAVGCGMVMAADLSTRLGLPQRGLARPARQGDARGEPADPRASARRRSVYRPDARRQEGRGRRDQVRAAQADRRSGDFRCPRGRSARDACRLGLTRVFITVAAPALGRSGATSTIGGGSEQYHRAGCAAHGIDRLGVPSGALCGEFRAVARTPLSRTPARGAPPSSSAIATASSIRRRFAGSSTRRRFSSITKGDLFRTRLTHSLEVAQIARSVARNLRLNEDLVEAISLAHDLGHTPFGHAGQEALHECMRAHGGFEHNLQSLVVVDQLEEYYGAFDGLNLCFETREGILKHCSRENAQALGELGERFLLGRQPSLEAQIANLADEIAYNNHDIDDGLRSGLLTLEQLDALSLWREHRDAALGAFPSLAGRRLIHETIRRMINALIVDLSKRPRRILAGTVPNRSTTSAAPRRWRPTVKPWRLRRSNSSASCSRSCIATIA